jgi:hypothetical protein
MSRSYTSSPPCASIGVLWDCFTFYLYFITLKCVENYQWLAYECGVLGTWLQFVHRKQNWKQERSLRPVALCTMLFSSHRCPILQRGSVVSVDQNEIRRTTFNADVPFQIKSKWLFSRSLWKDANCPYATFNNTTVTLATSLTQDCQNHVLSDSVMSL